jgi:hypothetical protein
VRIEIFSFSASSRFDLPCANCKSTVCSRVHQKPGDENKHQCCRGNRANIDKGALDTLLSTRMRSGDRRADIINEDAGPKRPLPILKADHIGTHLGLFTGRRFEPQMAVIPAAPACLANELRGDRHIADVTKPDPVLVDRLRPARHHKVPPVIVDHKEMAVLTIDHRGQRLHHFAFGVFITGRGIAVSRSDRCPRDRE